MSELYEGLDVDFWSQEQTINPKPTKQTFAWYSGYDNLNRGLNWYDDLGFPEIPLEIRYRSFVKRLERVRKRMK